MIGRTLSTYRVVDKLGAGGMGEVYRARDLKLDREVALKVLPPGLLEDETARSRFRKEAKALSRLTHPHIATLLDFGSADGIDYLVMKLVPGLTLGEALRKGPLPVKEVVRLGTQLARGLMAAHEQGIVHRDLKPSNLCLTGDGLLKILDFGLAHLTPVPSQGGGGETPTETAAGKVVGSPPYMSPEQLLGKVVDARSDVYSAGACLYELVTGRRPYGERSGAALTDAILHEAPEPVRRANAEAPEGLQSVIAKAMDKDPGLRYQSAAELLVDLERLQQGSEAGASGEARGRASAATASSWRSVPRVVGGAVVVLLVAAAIWLGWPPRPPRILGARTLTRGLVAGANLGWASDGTRLYYSDVRAGVTKYYQIPIAGGEPIELPIRVGEGEILAYLPRQGVLLVMGSDTVNTQDTGLPLWLVAPPSGGVRRLGDLKAWFAAVSPDEQRLALVYGAEHELRIGLAKADGSGLRELLKLPASVDWGWVTWAPDGERLRFLSAGPAAHEHEGWMWETSVRGDTPRPLWQGGVGSWTPDGRHFVFSRPERPDGWLRVWSRGDIWASRDRSWLPWPQSSPVQLSFGPMSLICPIFDPDGRHLFAWGDVRWGELLRFDAATKRLESYLGGVSGHYVDASPDGQWVAFITYPEDELWKSRPDGSQKMQLSRPGTVAGFPHWSPDGHEIAFVGSEPGEDGLSLRRVSAEGGAEEVLARPEPGANFWDACWLPDGEALVFSRLSDTQPGIFKLDLRTKQVSSLPGAEKLLYPKCSRHGDLLAAQALGTGRILWHGRTDWEEIKEIDGLRLAYPNWTRDGQGIIVYNWGAQRVERLDLKTRHMTTVVDLTRTPLVTRIGVPWMGLAADDSPLVLRDRGTRDIYALDWEAP